MDKLLLEIQKIQSRMGILVETTIPPSIWSKLTKYFDEVAGVGKKELDNLSEKGLIDPNELKWLNQNADLIKSKASKLIYIPKAKASDRNYNYLQVSHQIYSLLVLTFVLLMNAKYKLRYRQPIQYILQSTNQLKLLRLFLSDQLRNQIYIRIHRMV